MTLEIALQVETSQVVDVSLAGPVSKVEARRRAAVSWTQER